MNIKILENKLQTILENDNFKITKENIADKIEELLEEKLPLFLDDTLSQYDDNRAMRTAKFLKDALENSQAIMFTCHKSVEEICDNLSCNIIELEWYKNNL